MFYSDIIDSFITTDSIASLKIYSASNFKLINYILCVIYLRIIYLSELLQIEFDQEQVYFK